MYGVFLIAELGRLKGVLDKDSEYDLLWETASGMYKEFEKSEFNVDTKGEYDCIVDYLNSIETYTIVNCLNCGYPQPLLDENIIIDNLGKHIICEDCNASFDI
jgi:hypothetical protein